MNLYDEMALWLVGTVLVLLGIATLVAQLLKRQTDLGLDPAMVVQVNLKVRAWWILCAVLAAAILVGQTATVVLFGLLSFWALREFITLTPTRVADHRALFWVFVLFTPLQYVLVGMDQYGLYSVLIPVYAFLFVPARIALAGDYKRYLQRCATIQTGLMICVYCLSYAPALLYLQIPDAQAPPQSRPLEAQTQPVQQPAPQPPSFAPPLRITIDKGPNTRLLLFFVLVVTLGDAFQFVCEKFVGRNVIAAAISPNRTWEGFLGGVGCATLFGMAMWWSTPFEIWQAALMSLVIATMGFAGGMTMSAIKRDRGVKDYGTLVHGHGGVLDRIDSVCFAAPVFYHFTRFLFPQS